MRNHRGRGWVWRGAGRPAKVGHGLHFSWPWPLPVRSVAREKHVADIPGRLDARREHGDNPHLWYDPATMPKVAQKLSATFTLLDPADKDYFAQRLRAFDASEKALDDQIAAMKAKDAGTAVLPTEPVFDYLAEALGLTIVDQEGAFQKAVEEGNDPPASAVAEFRQQIASHMIKAFIYNSQTVTPITTQLEDDAKQNGVPIVPVSETEPEGKTYQQWMLDQLETFQQALGR
ncbi:MAG TPA: zinc ABC transporter substrate-binding protein [Chloroflexota bacterium]|nr:zinc ABC transporter substrate-binding protein [Chloroflexota bacterium]